MRALTLLTLSLAPALALAQAPPRDTFHVKYVAEGGIYLDAGLNASLHEGLRLHVKRPAQDTDLRALPSIAEIEIVSVASSTAVCEIRSLVEPIRVGDVAQLSAADAQALQLVRTSTTARKYLQVISFTEGDPLDEEARERVPRPKMPEVNRLRGWIGLEAGAILDRSAGGLNSSQQGLVLRADMTRIGGTYWNLSGYTRLRRTSRGAGPRTLTDLLNRTYHMQITYDSPKSRWVLGAGRLYLPWATSLSTIDGGYFGSRISRHFTTGVFGGSTPDPTSWNYKPGRQIFGAFGAYEGGSFDRLRYTASAGFAVTRLYWRPERQFVFAETSLFYKQLFSVFHNLEADVRPNGLIPAERSNSGPSLQRSFLTVRAQPRRYLTFDFSHNYFRTLPTFETALISAGLLDRLLFEGLSGGVRLDLPHRLSVYGSLGRSTRTGDERRTLNSMYGVSKQNLLGTGIRADFRRTVFDSSFGRGAYEMLSLSREFHEQLRLEIQGGRQSLHSPLTRNTQSHYLNTTLDWFLLRHYVLGAGVTVYRGNVQEYEQIFFNLGYRF